MNILCSNCGLRYDPAVNNGICPHCGRYNDTPEGVPPAAGPQAFEELPAEPEELWAPPAPPRPERGLGYDTQVVLSTCK